MAVTMHLSPTFLDTTKPDAARVRFGFSATGTKQAGALYVNMDRTGAGILQDAEAAARKAAKRAGCDTVTLFGISAPDR